ncbi:MAG: hypothetical protein Q4G09_03480 [Clostridia bacterium]|nr:hypothetical protein [Clostridia bacterium]
MEDKKQIRIPRQIRIKTEFFIGFGMEELIKTLIVGAIAGVVAYIVYKITNQTIIATLLVIGAITVSVISLIKGNNNFSMVDTIKNIIKYESMQKEYRYERGDYNIKVISKKENKKS